MYKIMNRQAPNYLINLFPKCQQFFRTRNSQIPAFHCRTDNFKYSFFPSTLNDWFNLDDNTKKSESISIFKNRILSFIRPIQSKFYNIFDPTGLKYLIRLRLEFSHLNEHRFRHNFQECINPLCSCSLDIENTIHYLLHCRHFLHFRKDLINSVRSVCDDFESFHDNVKKDILLYGDSRLEENKNRSILIATISYTKNTERFSGSLFE